MVFADTSFLYASLVAKDRNHDDAVALARTIADRAAVTTSLVVGECWTLLNRRWGHDAARRFLDGISRSGAIETAHVDEGLETSAFEWLRERDEREYSFVDATSFAYMRDNRITEALAFDGDFGAAGFVELRP